LDAGRISSIDERELARVVTLAAAVHDLGKCSDHFQAMIRAEREAPQLVRHEALSLWLCWPGQVLADWLRPSVGSDHLYAIAIAAAAGHHRKFWGKAFAARESGAGTATRLLLSHNDFASTLRSIARTLGLAEPRALVDEEVAVSMRSSPQRRFEEWEDAFDDELRRRPHSANFLAIVKALVLAADVAGSSLPRAAERPDWIAEQLDARASDGEMRSIVDLRLSGRSPRPFQNHVADAAAPLSLVTAGCGSGKTAAAYLWAARQHIGRQLWVTYPTTGTATEGFRDYVFGADVDGRLEHGRATVDIDIFDLVQDGDADRERDRLDAIRAWGCDVVTCTVDVVLGITQNQRKGLYAWPGLAHSALVFDEIHAYDDALFGSLLRFLEAVPGIPALLMTASLPSARLDALRALALRVHHQPLLEIAGPVDLETLPRYARDMRQPVDAVVECLNAGGKVLWVSNTVDRCMRVADGSWPTAPAIYHSRFRYIDRVSRHGAVIDSFKADGAAFATTTQVAEMSLDLSADLLVTDLAPIPALIQRLGRLNRRSTPDAPTPVKPFIVIEVDGMPYDSEEYAAARAWLDSLGTAPLSQRDLVRAWSAAPSLSDALCRSQQSAWLDGRFRTEPASLREASPGITLLRGEDAADVRAGTRRPVEVAIPMTVGGAIGWQAWPRLQGYPVAPRDALRYDPMRGATWA
jgi:CRISPR-associated endonuclease/helicase Cas3